jgi:hypothetical protein
LILLFLFPLYTLVLAGAVFWLTPVKTQKEVPGSYGIEGRGKEVSKSCVLLLTGKDIPII